MINIEEIKDTVKELISKYQTTDIYYICNCLDIHIIKDYIYPLKAFFTNSNRIKIITLDYDLQEHEKDIVMYHELGHAIMHPDMSHTFFHRCTKHNTNIFENEANIFAMYFILEKYKDELEYITNLSEISQITGLNNELLNRFYR